MDTVANSSIDLITLTQELQGLLPRVNKNEIIHQNAYELAYDTIPEMLVPVNSILVDGKINNIPIKILFDTGADLSVISNTAVDKLNMNDMIDTQASTICKGVNGMAMTLGELWFIELEIANNIFPVKLTVLRTDFIDCDMIIGLNFMRSYKARIDFVSNEIILNDKYHISF